MGIIEKYFAGQNDGLQFDDQSTKVLFRPWYYPVIVVTYWGLVPFWYISGFFLIIIHVAKGDIELPPDNASVVAFYVLALAYVLVISAALFFSFKGIYYEII